MTMHHGIMANDLIKRTLVKIQGNPQDPAVVFFTGIHGNEPAGVQAFEQIEGPIDDLDIKGSLYVLSGNRKALARGVRFIDKDLNRIWTKTNLEKVAQRTLEIAEEEEQRALFKELKSIVEYHTGPLYFIDFHTTSSPSLPFITINDAMINRKFSRLFPVPIILGIEEYLEGPLLSYINRLGYVSLGFESGQHGAAEAVEHAKAFMYLTLVFSGLLSVEHVPGHEEFYQKLSLAAENKAHFYDIIHRHEIQQKDEFKMEPGFKSFEQVKKGTLLAYHNGGPIEASKNTVLFMPLYQAQGEEGFFLIRAVPAIFLRLSALLRRLRLENILSRLPGIGWASPRKEALQIDLKLARFFTRPFFHLLGYRQRQVDKTHVRLFNREHVTKKDRYKGTTWY